MLGRSPRTHFCAIALYVSHGPMQVHTCPMAHECPTAPCRSHGAPFFLWVWAVWCLMPPIVMQCHGLGWIFPFSLKSRTLITTGRAAVDDFWSPCEISVIDYVKLD